ncbi:MAG: GNAT family N-acetyltransferase [Pseudomonadota bacterium]
MSLRLIAQPDMTSERWAGLTHQVPQLPLTQSWAYGEGMASARGWLPGYYTLETPDQGTIGGCIIQRQHAGLSEAIRIERGPFFTQAVDHDLFAQTMVALETETKPRWLDRRRFYPSVAADTAAAKAIPQSGFRPIDPGYHTIWLDLTVSGDERRQRLRQNWRHALSKAERSDVTIIMDDQPDCLPWLISHHVNDMRRRRYIGPTASLLTSLGARTAPQGDFLLVRALYLGKPVAGALFIRHGLAATYLVGWSGKVGRKYNAQHLILWQALDRLHAHHVQHLDLGGLNPKDAPGVTYFKRGLLTAHDEESLGAPVCR